MITNNNTKMTIDMTPLKGQNNTVSYNGSLYSITICGTSRELNCSALNGSVCQYSTTIINTTSNATIETFLSVIAKYDNVSTWTALESGGVALQMTDGQACAETQQPPLVTINFPCNVSAGRIGAVNFSITAPCIYNITIPTAVSCPNYGCLNGPCKNGGSCTPGMTSTSYTCRCPCGFTGTNCEETTSNNDDSGDESKARLTGGAIGGVVGFGFGLVCLLIYYYCVYKPKQSPEHQRILPS